MPEHQIELTLAGAGSGKTTRVVRYHLEAVQAGVPQAGIFISTYTRKAAGEIRARVGSAMVKAGLAEEAATLAGARIGTVHSIGQSLLDQFSFALGLSPGLKVMDERRQRAVLARVTASVFSGKEVSHVSDLHYRLGQEGGWGSDNTPLWLTRILAIIDQARSNGMGAHNFRDMATRSVDHVFGNIPAAQTGLEQFTAGFRAVRPQLADLVEGYGATHGGKPLNVSQEALKKLDSIVRKWESGSGFNWQVFRGLKWGKKDGSQAMWDSMGLDLDGFYNWQEFREDYTAYVHELFAMAGRTFDAYERFKREAGLLDYADLESKLLELLELEEARQYISEKVSLVIIDEFQDTSPLQLAIFMKLAALVPRTVWVGDPKQAIYDFRGSDPLLVMETLSRLEKAGRARRGDYLGISYRSRPELVEYVNNAFENVFTEQGIRPEEVRLKAHAKPDASLSPALGRWHYPSGRGNAFGSSQAPGVLADMVAELLSQPEKCLVRDKAANHNRPVCPGDIAVLCRTNDDCARVAVALEALNVPADCERPGLASEPEVGLCLAGLTLAFNPADPIAAAIVTFWNDCPLGGRSEGDWLAERLEFLKGGGEAPWKDHPVIQSFSERCEDLRELDPALALPEVMSLCGVKKIVSGWRNPKAHLDRLDWLMDLAGKYREECRGLGLCASITGFLRYMALLRESGEDKSEGDSGGVQVCTWHRSKGLEWPITIIQDWDKPVEPLRNMLGVSVYQTSAMDPDSPLANRELLFILSPFQPKWNSAFHDHLRSTRVYRLCESRAVNERIRLLYTLYTRARDQLIFFGPTKQARVSAGSLVINSLPAEGAPDWDVRTRQLSDLGHSLSMQQRLVWFTYADAPPGGGLAVVSPSQGAGDAAHGVRATLTLALDLGKGLEINAPNADKRNIGNALHGFFAVDRDNLDGGAQRELARRLVRGWGLDSALNPGALVEYADAWDAGMAAFFKGASIQREVPLALQWGDVLLRGEADWLAETDSEIAIVDHKSYHGNQSEAEKEALRHAPQLAAYALAVEKAAGKPVTHTYIHFPAMGWLMEVGMNRETRRKLVEGLAGTENF